MVASWQLGVEVPNDDEVVLTLEEAAKRSKRSVEDLLRAGMSGELTLCIRARDWPAGTPRPPGFPPEEGGFGPMFRDRLDELVALPGGALQALMNPGRSVQVEIVEQLVPERRDRWQLDHPIQITRADGLVRATEVEALLAERGKKPRQSTSDPRAATATELRKNRIALGLLARAWANKVSAKRYGDKPHQGVLAKEITEELKKVPRTDGPSVPRRGHSSKKYAERIADAVAATSEEKLIEFLEHELVRAEEAAGTLGPRTPDAKKQK